MKSESCAPLGAAQTFFSPARTALAACFGFQFSGRRRSAPRGGQQACAGDQHNEHSSGHWAVSLKISSSSDFPETGPSVVARPPRCGTFAAGGHHVRMPL